MIDTTLAPESELEPTKISANDVLKTYLPFEEKRYEQIKGTEDCSYYLEVLEQGFKKASEFKSIPLDTLLSLIDKFKKGEVVKMNGYIKRNALKRKTYRLFCRASLPPIIFK